MKVVQDGYQRGPVHIGKFEMQIRTYVWTEKQVEAYKKLKEEESMILMGNVSKAVEEAMNSLSEELDKYLEEARGQKKEVPETAEKTKNTFMQAMFGDFYRASPKTQKPKKKSRKQIYGEKKSMDSSRTAAKGHAQANGFIHYKNFKKAHGMVMW
tara:strand:- start:34 stop:498 length:465 start_codon:yes stop_codon:yes gene_type:complete